MKELKIRVDAKGKVTVEVEGVTGSGCQQLTEGLLRELGAKDPQTELKEEFYAEEKQSNYEVN